MKYIETEVKIKVSEIDFRRIRLEVESPEFKIEKNCGYLIPDGLLRIRNYGTKKFITLKKKALGPYNSRLEIEFEISDFESALLIFSYLGLSDKFYYEKERATVNYEGCY